jgi:hypothetical protein
MLMLNHSDKEDSLSRSRPQSNLDKPPPRLVEIGPSAGTYPVFMFEPDYGHWRTGALSNQGIFHVFSSSKFYFDVKLTYTNGLAKRSDLHPGHDLDLQSPEVRQ